jgi:hypothetical protein
MDRLHRRPVQFSIDHATSPTSTVRARVVHYHRVRKAWRTCRVLTAAQVLVHSNLEIQKTLMVPWTDLVIYSDRLGVYIKNVVSGCDSLVPMLATTVPMDMWLFWVEEIESHVLFVCSLCIERLAH